MAVVFTPIDEYLAVQEGLSASDYAQASHGNMGRTYHVIVDGATTTMQLDLTETVGGETVGMRFDPEIVLFTPGTANFNDSRLFVVELDRDHVLLQKTADADPLEFVMFVGRFIFDTR